MASRLDTMSGYDSDTHGEAWHLFRKVFLVLLVVTASALGLVILSRRGSNVPLVLYNILVDASLGVLAGLATRFALKDRHGLIRGLTSAALSIVGLAIVGYFTNWRSGIGPIQAGTVTVHWLDAAHIPLRLPIQFGRSGMDILDLVHAIIAMDISWIALRVWKPRNVTTVAALQPAAAPRVRRPAVRPAVRPAAASPSPSVPARRIPASGRSDTRPRVKRRRADRPLVSRAAPPIRPKPRRAASLRHSRPVVRLAVYEEHRCPYCFEPVTRNDPRGVVECQICHTLHHKDCWDVTGNCQVPHLTT